MFCNPKRFLIHTKWHTLGFNKKTERAKRREIRRNEKREARMMEKMNEVVYLFIEGFSAVTC